MPKRPTADETRDAARILREVLEQTSEGNLSDAGARGMVRRIEGAALGLEASAGEA
jgi:hypothetical protein